MKLFILALLSTPFLFLAGCSSQQLASYEGTTPNFVLEDYFDGKVIAYGIVQDRSGTVKRRFRVDINGLVEGNTITLDEDFFYYDGETDKRIWRIEKTADGRYAGRADDIIGTAEGIVEGAALSWMYQMDLDVGDKTYRVTFDDWMYMMQDGVMINRADIKKFGLTVAEVTLFFMKEQ